MPEAQNIIEFTFAYLTYLAAPLLIFCAIATADLIVNFAVDLTRKAKSSYRL